MSKLKCEFVRDVYPDVLNGTLEPATADAVRAHVASCEECRAEVGLLDALHAQRTFAPAGLHERVMSGLVQRRIRRRFNRSDMAMAATLAAALIGGSLLLQTQRGENPRTAVTGQATAPLGVGFVGVEDAMLSGDASLEDLSVEQLEQLLGEIES